MLSMPLGTVKGRMRLGLEKIRLLARRGARHFGLERGAAMSVWHEPYRDELAAYALGALEPSEVETLERHLSDCGECRDYLFWLDPAVGLLPRSSSFSRPSG